MELEGIMKVDLMWLQSGKMKEKGQVICLFGSGVEQNPIYTQAHLSDGRLSVHFNARSKVCGQLDQVCGTGGRYPESRQILFSCCVPSSQGRAFKTVWVHLSEAKSSS